MRSGAQTSQQKEGLPYVMQRREAGGFTVVEGLSVNNNYRSHRSCQSVQSASGSAPFRDQPVTSCATTGIDL